MISVNKTGYHQEDRALVNRVLHGDTYAFKQIMQNSERMVTQIVFKMISSAEDRKDVAQDIYLKVYHHLNGFRFTSKLTTWIAQIAYNTCINYLRKRKERLLDDPDIMRIDGNEPYAHTTNGFLAKADALLERKEFLKMIHSGLEQLSPIYRTLIVLYHEHEIEKMYDVRCTLYDVMVVV